MQNETGTNERPTPREAAAARVREHGNGRCWRRFFMGGENDENKAQCVKEAGHAGPCVREDGERWVTPGNLEDALPVRSETHALPAPELGQLARAAQILREKGYSETADRVVDAGRHIQAAAEMEHNGPSSPATVRVALRGLAGRLGDDLLRRVARLAFAELVPVESWLHNAIVRTVTRVEARERHQNEATS